MSAVLIGTDITPRWLWSAQHALLSCTKDIVCRCACVIQRLLLVCGFFALFFCEHISQINACLSTKHERFSEPFDYYFWQHAVLYIEYASISTHWAFCYTHTHTFLLQAFHVHKFLHAVWVLEPELHADKGLPALQAQLVPGFRPGQQVWDRTLSQTQDSLPKQTLTWFGERKWNQLNYTEKYNTTIEHKSKKQTNKKKGLTQVIIG